MEVFIQIAGILLLAFVVSYIISIFRQPIVIGYIIAGVVAAFIIELAYFDLAASSDILSTFSQFGIAFLLFIVGLHLNPKVIKEIGVASLFIGLGQMILTFVAGFFASVFILGYNYITSAYIGIALMFSSTIIVMKLLSDKKQIDSLYGKIAIGVLIIQDLVAVGVLMFISSMSGEVNMSSFAIKSVLGGCGLIGFLFFLSYFGFPKFINSIARSQELLFLFSIFWCFLIASIFEFVGFSIEIGALIAGVTLSISPFSTEISSKIRPLRDFFLILFFIILGLNVHISSIQNIFMNAIILSVIVLTLKPLFLTSLMAIFNYTKRNNFFLGITLAQISEFSLIILALGVSIGHISNEILSTLTLTGIITITLSTYMIIYSNKFYNKMKYIMAIFERKKVRKRKEIKKEYDAILFGYNRIGFNILRSLKRIKKDYLVVDFNPDTIANLTHYRIPNLYGDVYDCEFLEELPLDKIKLAVSTIPDFETNFILIEHIRVVNPDAVIIVRAHSIEDALKLYEKGASYVLTPHFLGGEYIANMIGEDKINEDKYKKEKRKHIQNLKKMLEAGHRHPEIEKN